MTVLLEPPVEVVWAEQAGPMSWVEDPSWDLPPIDWPNLDLETAYWAAERAAALAPDRPRLASPEEGWAVPGVFENHPPPGRPGPSAELTALGLAVDGLEQAKPAADPVQALADLGELLRIDEQPGDRRARAQARPARR